jgi:hypothetical protein
MGNPGWKMKQNKSVEGAASQAAPFHIAGNKNRRNKRIIFQRGVDILFIHN